MERLTEQIGEDEDRRAIPRPDIRSNGHGRCCNKLAEYEDAEKQGLLVRLPCKVGDDIYVIPSQSIYGINIVNGFEELNRVYHQHIGSITFFDSHWYATSREEYGIYNEKVLNDIDYGITWFTDYEEAEKKLEEMQNDKR